MGVLDWLRPWRNQLPPAEQTMAPIVDYLVEQVSGQGPAELWRSQPHLRTVVDFLARNVAQLGLHVYQRDADGGRTRLREAPVATLLNRPSPDQTTYELVRGIVADAALFDIAFVLVVVTKNGWELRPLRPAWVSVAEASPFAVVTYAVTFPGQSTAVKIPASQMIVIHGWSPLDETKGASPVGTLRDLLAEQTEATLFRQQMWKRGGRVGTYITRPNTSPGMNAEARLKFQRQFNEAWTGDGAKAGGVPFLDEGAELKSLRFNAKEEQWVEATQLSLRTVASVYHVQPAMVGDTAGVSYANVREFRKMLYGETLGPLLMQIEQRLNHVLGGLLGFDDDVYIEFNVDQRLRGDAEEQANILRQGVGAPYMTINEARARLNLPAAESGDELVKPLNVTQDGDTDPTPAEEPAAAGTQQQVPADEEEPA